MENGWAAVYEQDADRALEDMEKRGTGATLYDFLRCVVVEDCTTTGWGGPWRHRGRRRCRTMREELIRGQNLTQSAARHEPQPPLGEREVCFAPLMDVPVPLSQGTRLTPVMHRHLRKRLASREESRQMMTREREGEAQRAVRMGLTGVEAFGATQERIEADLKLEESSSGGERLGQLDPFSKPRGGRSAVSEMFIDHNFRRGCSVGPPPPVTGDISAVPHLLPYMDI